MTATNCAISDKGGLASFRIEKISGHKPGKSKREEEFWYDNLGGNLRAEKIGSDYVEFPVETRRLDDEILDNVGFMKIDVEGHVFEVLEGARRTLELNRPVMLIEIEGRYNGRPIAKALSEVKSLEYSGFAYTPDGLKSVSVFDTAKHCDARSYQDYHIFNFVFFPRQAK